MIAALLAFTILGNQGGAWVPTELVEFEDRSERVVYVLDVSDGWFTMVGVSDRRVDRVPVDEVTSRTVCDLTSDRSLNQIVGDVKPQERCPSPHADPEGE